MKDLSPILRARPSDLRASVIDLKVSPILERKQAYRLYEDRAEIEDPWVSLSFAAITINA